MSSEESDDDGGGYIAIGSAFAALQGIDDDDEWQEVGAKKKAGKAARATAQPAATSTAAPGRGAQQRLTNRPTETAASTSRTLVAPAARPVQPTAPAPAPAPAPPPVAKPKTHDENGRPLGDDYYRAFQRCYVAANGDVVLRFHKTDIVRIKQSGDVLLYCGGYFTATTMWSMNDALQFINVTVKASNVRSGSTWVVQSEMGSTPYMDNQVVVPGRTPAHRQRGQLVLDGMRELLGRQDTDPNAPAARSQHTGQQRAGASYSSNSAAAAGGARLPPQQQAGYAARQQNSISAGPSVTPTISTPVAQQQQSTSTSYQLPSPSTIPGAVYTDSQGSVPWIPGATTMSYAERLRAKQQQAQAQHQQAAPGTAGGNQAGPSGSGSGVTGGSAGVAASSNAAAAAAGPAEFAARSANLTADAFSPFLAALEGSEMAGNAAVDDDELLCIVCTVAGRDAVLIPCSHCVLCAKCADVLVEKHGTCPLCRQEVDTVLHIEG